MGSLGYSKNWSLSVCFSILYSEMSPLIHRQTLKLHIDHQQVIFVLFLLRSLQFILFCCCCCSVFAQKKQTDKKMVFLLFAKLNLRLTNRNARFENAYVIVSNSFAMCDCEKESFRFVKNNRRRQNKMVSLIFLSFTS